MTLGSGVALSDSATLSGGYYPTGSIIFILEPVEYVYIVPVNGNGTYTTHDPGMSTGGSPIPTLAGTDQWIAVYTGDDNNLGAGDPSVGEPETVNPASPTLSTTPGGTVTLGSGETLSDSAQLHGAVNPTGTVTFSLYDPNNVLVYTDPVTIINPYGAAYTDNSGTPSDGNVPTIPGIYQWDASYSGDANNNPVSDNNNPAEQETVQIASNFRPLPVKQSASTSVDTPITLTLQANDPDGDPLTYSIFRQPANGSVTLVNDQATYTPNPGFTGADEFTFQANDGFVDSNLGVVRVAVVEQTSPAPPPPITGTPPPQPSANLPPDASAGPKQVVHAGDTVSFAGEATDPEGPGDITRVQWDFNYHETPFVPDPSATTLSPTHIYSTPGVYAAALQVTDVAGNTALDVATIEVKDADALIVKAGPDEAVPFGAVVSFSGSYSDPGSPVSPAGVAWDLDYDGQTFTPTILGTLTPTFSYTQAGSHTVALQVTDSAGNSDISLLTVNVGAQFVGPTANAGPDQKITEGQTASFNGAFTDPDGAVSGVAWDFNYNGVAFNPQAEGTLTPTHQFPTPGTYTVALQVTDSNNLTSISTLQVTVSNVVPTVLAGPDQTITVGTTATFNGSFTDPGGPNDVSAIAWDFNYDGVVFQPSSDTGLTAVHTFIGPGTYTVALEVTDQSGDTGISTLTVTVDDQPTFVVDAGPDQVIDQGNTAQFDGRYVDLTGIQDPDAFGPEPTVDPSTAQWDFTYNGNFVPDPSAAGMFTPNHVFNTPGSYTVALQLTDSLGNTQIGTTHILVANVGPDVDAGPDQTIKEGDTANFSATVADPRGPGDITSIQWDFNYDGANFVPNPAAAGTLKPSHQFLTVGSNWVAVQVTDAQGNASLGFLNVTVNNVASTATVTSSGPITEGSKETFTITHASVPDPTDTFTYSADWTGSGELEDIPSSELTTNPDGSISFSHYYDDNPSTPGGYNAVIRITDAEGGSTDYPQSVVVNNVPPAATFGPSGGLSSIAAGVPIQFSNVTDPSLADTVAGFKYFYSVNGGNFAESSSPNLFLPNYLPHHTYSVRGFIVDKDGGTSAIYTTTVTVVPTATYVVNHGTGYIQLTWDKGGHAELGPNQYFVRHGVLSNLTATMETSDATYTLETTGSFHLVNALAGVKTVNLTVRTDNVDLGGTTPARASRHHPALPAFTGNGNVDEVDLPPGDSADGPSLLSIFARGDLGNVAGPHHPGKLWTDSLDLFFANLTGSITGLDHIGHLAAQGWLGTSTAEQVWTQTGIDYLAAYGIGATVVNDRDFDTSDALALVDLGDGGLTGVFDPPPNQNINVFTLPNKLGGIGINPTTKKLSGALPLDNLGNVQFGQGGFSGTFYAGQSEIAVKNGNITGKVDVANGLGQLNFQNGNLQNAKLALSQDGKDFISFANGKFDAASVPLGLSGGRVEIKNGQLTGGSVPISLIEDGSTGTVNITTDQGNPVVGVQLKGKAGSITINSDGSVQGKISIGGNVVQFMPGNKVTIQLSNGFNYDARGPIIQSGTPIEFTNVVSPSAEDTDAGFTYFYSTDGTNYTSDTSPEFFLPDYSPGLSYTVSACIQAQDGAKSPVYKSQVTVASDLVVENLGTGTAQVSEAGGGSTTLGPGQSFDFGNATGNLTATLMTSAASYDLRTNGSFDLVQAAKGVGDVQLIVRTDLDDDLPSFLGDGHVGEVDLPKGTNTQESTLSVYARGDLGNIVGPNGKHPDAEAIDLFFANLTGSIAGLDHVHDLDAFFALGNNAAEQIGILDGVDNLVVGQSIGATVVTDIKKDKADPGTTVTVGPGGVTGSLTLGPGPNLVQSQDTAGNVTSITDPAGNKTAFTYDSNNNPVTMTDPLGKVLTRTFDQSGNLLSQVNRNGLRQEYTYNNNNQILTATWYAANGSILNHICSHRTS